MRRRPSPVAPVLWALWTALLIWVTVLNILDHSWVSVAAGGIGIIGACMLLARSIWVYARRRNHWLLAEHRRALSRRLFSADAEGARAYAEVVQILDRGRRS